MRLMTAVGIEQLKVTAGGPGSGRKPGVSLHEVGLRHGFKTVSDLSHMMSHPEKGRLSLDEGTGGWKHTNVYGDESKGTGFSSLHAHLSNAETPSAKEMARRGYNFYK